MKLFYVFSCLIYLNYIRCTCTSFDKDSIKVTIDQGSLIGRTAQDYVNDTYYIFEGIPYAKPPIGELRFKAPEPAEPWTGIYDATKPKLSCPQIPSHAVPADSYSEDCLFVNVHTKMIDGLSPVMVWIHGGGFDAGSINTKFQGSQFLMAENIVLVDIQYRLNIFGFLSFDDPKYDIRGNAGLKDQVLALKWVQKNIQCFGGDPNQVTIFGESAGGASVHLLYASPSAKGLFHRAIAQSGSGANTWVQSVNKYPQLAEILNCPTSNLDETVNCINSTSTDDLLQAAPILKQNPNHTIVDGLVMNVLTIEDENSKDPFMTDTTENNIKNGNFNKVPLIMGVCANESALFWDDRPNVGPDFNESQYEELIPKDLKIEKGSLEAFNVGRQIKEFYYGKQTPSVDLLDPWIRYVSDLMFITNMYRIAKIQASSWPNIPVYFFNFNYYTSLNFGPISNKYVRHGDDLAYLFNFNGEEVSTQLDPNSDEYIGMHRMVKLWTTFAKSKNGDPNPENDPLFNNVIWKPVEPDNFYYLHINPNLELQLNLYEDRMTFWDNLYGQYS